MKPSWKDAPAWANWLAMDQDGRWFWYEKCPLRDDYRFFIDEEDRGQCNMAGKSSDWEKSLTARPRKKRGEP